jgi:hypothetical protein
VSPIEDEAPQVVVPEGVIDMEQDKGETERIISTLKQIDVTRLDGGRTGANKKAYSLLELKTFAQEIGLTVSGKKKITIIDELLEKRRVYGVNIEEL